MGALKQFSLNRFYKALKYNLFLNAKSYIYFALGLFFIVLIVAVFIVNNLYKNMPINNFKEEFIKNYHYIAFIFTFSFSALIAIGTAFPYFRNKNSTSTHLMLPASVFEKFLVEFTIRIILFNVFFIVIYWLDFKLAGFIFDLFMTENKIDLPNFKLLSPFYYLSDSFTRYAVVLSLFSFNVFLLAGACHFKKYAFFKVIFSIAFLIVIAYILSVILSRIFLPNEVDGFEFEIFDRKMGNINNIQFYLSIIGVFSSLFLLPLAYFKLKEKEV